MKQIFLSFSVLFIGLFSLVVTYRDPCDNLVEETYRKQ